MSSYCFALGKWYLSMVRQKGSISQLKAFVQPAHSAARSNPPIPLNSDAWVIRDHRLSPFPSITSKASKSACVYFFILFYCLLTQSVKAHTTGRRIVVEQTARRVLPLDVAHDIVYCRIFLSAGNRVGGYLVWAEKIRVQLSFEVCYFRYTFGRLLGNIENLSLVCHHTRPAPDALIPHRVERIRL